jgi:hypothetical protein
VIPDGDLGDVAADLDDLACPLVAEDERPADAGCAGVIDVQVRVAHAGRGHCQPNLVSADRGDVQGHDLKRFVGCGHDDCARHWILPLALGRASPVLCSWMVAGELAYPRRSAWFRRHFSDASFRSGEL